MSGLLRTGVLLAVMTALFTGVGYLLGGPAGAIIALLIALVMNAVAYWNSDKMVLGMYGAQQVDHRSAPELYGIVSELAERAGLPMPKVFIIDSEQPNAFATGRSPDHASVAATTGLLRMCTREEIIGVMAHELAHVKNRDMLVMTITATIAGAIGMLATFAMFFGGSRDNNNPLGFVGAILIMIIAPIAAGLVQMAISRTREYEADRIGAEICGQPLWLASALERMHHAASHIDNEVAESRPATAHLFIVNPLNGRSMDSLFSTHPDVANRIARLEGMSSQMGQRPMRHQTRSDNSYGARKAGPWDRPTGPSNPKRRRGPWG